MRNKMRLAPEVKSLEELLALSKGETNYSNIDMKMLRKIRVHLEEMSNLIGMKDIKDSIAKQLMYFISHFHLKNEDSFLYKPEKKKRKIEKKTKDAKKSSDETESSSKKKSSKKRKGSRAEGERKKKKPKKGRRARKRKRSTDSEDEDDDSDDSDYVPSAEEEDGNESSSSSSEDDDSDNDETHFSSDEEEEFNEHTFQSLFMRRSKPMASIAPANPNAEYMNMVIYGDPGVGKSLVGSIIGKIFHEMGVFRTKRCREPFRIIHSDDLVGEYIGHTAVKTREVLEKSKGGVLMLDEAYAMNAMNGNHGDCFAQNALDTITAFLSENKDDIIFILAGYETDIKERIFTMNKGLERRFPWVHKISGYSAKELADIFIFKVTQAEWKIEVPSVKITETFEDRKHLFKNHAGDVERLFSEVKILHAQRTFSCKPADRKNITLKDIEAGLNRLANERAGAPNRDPPPFMYV